MRRYIHVIILCLFVTAAWAQQIPRYSAYMFDKAIINPAYAGSIPYINATVAHRTQFVGIDGGPVTQFLSFHAPIQKKNIGLGLKVVNDKAAVIKSTSAEFMFSYSLGLGNGKLSFGLEGGLFNQSIDFTGLVRHDAVDNALTFANESKASFDASAGVYYQAESFFVGWSSYQLTKSTFDYTGEQRDLITRLWNHNYGIIGYHFGNDEKVHYEPSILLKQVSGAPIQLDINFKSTYKQIAALGLSYRNSESLVFMTEVFIKESFRIGYAFDYTLSDLSTYQNGTHEIMLSYRKKLLPPARDKETHPRFYIY